MVAVTRTIFCIAMVLLGMVSMWTTYKSLYDSILPEPTIKINLAEGVVWDCSVFALLLSVAIGMMLFALKIAIIDEQKKLNVLGVVGLTIVGFISISFNLDVLYRIADRDFFIRYSTDRMRSVYENFMAQTNGTLIKKRDELRKVVAKQEGELDAEIKGLRTAPEGYGPIARKEDYRLTVLQKTSEVELKTVEEVLTKKEEADKLLRTALPKSLDEIQQLQGQLRVVVKDMDSAAERPMPEVVRLENPLFAVFSKVFDFRSVGIKEIFLVIVAFFLDLGDIIGYSLIPNRPQRKKQSQLALAGVPDFRGPEMVFPPTLGGAENESLIPLPDPAEALPRRIEPPARETDESESRPSRSFGIRRR